MNANEVAKKVVESPEIQKMLRESAIYKEYYEAEQAFHLMLPCAGSEEYVKAANRLNKARKAVRKLRGE